MKNLNGKTMIFYTFQLKKQQQYNVLSYKPLSQPICVKNVIQQLPIDLKSGKYHFRFKSEFNQGNQRIVGWIDITNLLAKVPLINGSIYVKILKLKSDKHNKLFNIQKLAKVGILNDKNTNIPVNVKNQYEQTNQRKPQLHASNGSKPQEKLNKKPSININPKPSINVNSKPTNTMNLIQQIQNNKNLKTSPQIQQNFMQFTQVKVFKSQQSTQQKVKFFNKMVQDQQRQKQNEKIAKEQLQQKINKWGYSGAKTINNLTTLLSTLHYIWPEWTPVSLSDLLKPEDVTNVCKKALIRTHPDKNRNKPFKQKYLAKRVFQLLNDAKKSL